MSFSTLPSEMQMLILKYFPRPKPKRTIIVKVEHVPEYLPMESFEIKCIIKVNVDMGDDIFTKDISKFNKRYQRIYISTGRMIERVIESLESKLLPCKKVYEDKVRELIEGVIPGMLCDMVDKLDEGGNSIQLEYQEEF